MINISQIISDIQNEIYDLAGERIQQGEYIDMCNSVARQIAQATDMYINRFSNVPNPSAMIWYENQNYTANQIISYSGTDYLVLVAHTSSLANLPDATPTIYSPFADWAESQNYLANVLIKDNNVYATALIDHTSTLNNRPSDSITGITCWRVISGGINAIYDVTLPYMLNAGNISPYRLIRVTRGILDSNRVYNSWIECREYSSQSVSATISNNPSFSINRNQLGASAFTVQFADRNNLTDGGLHLIFAEPFSADELCVVDFITNRPFGQPNLGITINGIIQTPDINSLQRWLPSYSNPQTIPDFLEDSFKYGLLFLVQQRLYNRGDESLGQRMINSKMLYDKELRKAIGYTKMFKDNQSSLKIQPMNYLQE
jgi:hypothetical protein